MAEAVAIPINLLHSEFNDSAKLFKSSVFDFWPLYIGILNLPPNLREQTEEIVSIADA